MLNPLLTGQRHCFELKAEKALLLCMKLVILIGYTFCEEMHSEHGTGVLCHRRAVSQTRCVTGVLCHRRAVSQRAPCCDCFK